MEINQQMILCCYGGNVLVELHDKLVVPVHEIHLESLDTHLGIVLEYPFDVLVDGLVPCPQDKTYVLCLGIGQKLFKVDLRDDLVKIGLLVDSPAFIEDDLFNAMLGSEIDVVLVSGIVDSGLEIDSVDVPVVPPVPCNLSGLYPAPVDSLVSRGSKQPGEV